MEEENEEGNEVKKGQETVGTLPIKSLGRIGFRKDSVRKTENEDGVILKPRKIQVLRRKA